MFSFTLKPISSECVLCGGTDGHHWPWCGKAAGISFGGCPGGQHYFVKQGGTWVCTICGETR